MVQKRGLIPQENPESQENQQRNQRVKSIISTCFPTRCLLKGEWVQEWVRENSAQIEESLRNVVQPVVESIIQHHPSIPRSLPNEAGPSKFRKFKLQFHGQLPCELYTGNSIEAEGSLPLQIVLHDAESGEVVTYGPLSLAKVEIVVLHGHFKVEMQEGWTQKEFNDNIVLARAGKSPLLFGECVIALRNGIGFVKGISFTDNSRWVRSNRFRLGARIQAKTAKEDEVREAVSSPFRVKHGRGAAYEKHSAPSLGHEVCHLQGIFRDGKIHNRLKDHQIYKVEDLLQQYHKDQSSLRNLIGSSKTWKAIQQIAASFPSDVRTVQSNCGPSLIPTDPILASAVPLSTSAASQEQEFQMPCTPRMETSCEVDGYMDPNLGAVIDNYLTEELLATSCDDGQNWPLDCNLPLSPPIGPLHGQATFNFPTSNLFSDDVHQSTVEAGKGSFLGATRITPIGTFSPVPSLGASTSQRAKPKRRFWSKIRAVWRWLLIKCRALL